MIIKRCSRGEYNQFLDMVNEAFNYTGSNSEWFQRNLPICTPYEKDALDVEIANHFIAVIGREVVAAVGAYPIDWVVSEDTQNGGKINIKSFGIGQVSCKKELRGKGIMTKLLDTAVSEMVSEGALIGFLGGDRERYSHFGFDFAGNSVEFNFSKWRFPKKASTEGLTVKKAGFSDYEAINGMYENLPSYIIRGERCWQKHFMRSNYSWLAAEKGGEAAYICVDASNRVTEAQGSIETVKALILWLMETRSLDSVNVSYAYAPFKQDPLYKALWASACSVSMRPIDLKAVCLPDKLFSLLTPVLIRQGFEKQLQGLGIDEKKELIELLFGFAAAPLGGKLQRFSGIRQLIFWLPAADNI